MQGMKYCPLPLYVWWVSSAAAVGSPLWRGDCLYSVVIACIAWWHLTNYYARSSPCFLLISMPFLPRSHLAIGIFPIWTILLSKLPDVLSTNKRWSHQYHSKGTCPPAYRIYYGREPTVCKGTRDTNGKRALSRCRSDVKRMFASWLNTTLNWSSQLIKFRLLKHVF